MDEKNRDMHANSYAHEQKPGSSFASGMSVGRREVCGFSNRLRRCIDIFRYSIRCGFILLGLSFAFSAVAQTTVSGAIGVNTHWTVANHPYILNGNISVDNGAVLSIDPGVVVYMSANSGLEVQNGGVQALGAQDKPISVLSDKGRSGQSPAPGDWGQWVFGPGAKNTKLDHVLFEHGRGLVVNGSAPVFNYLNVRNNLGAAISIDLAAAPSGVGIQASGNTINGIAVPAGEIGGNTYWGLRGIPYVVLAGVVSVGTAPAISAITPNVVEKGQTSTLTVQGVRLGGLQKATFDRAGLEATIFPGGSENQVTLQVKVDPSAPSGPAQLRLQVDAGEVLQMGAITVSAPMPFISLLDPSSVVAGSGPQEIKVSGRNFISASEVLFNAAAVPTQFVSSGELRATLPNQATPGTLQAQVRSPDLSNPAQSLLSAQVALSVQAPTPPTLSVEPTPIALPPDNKVREILLRLSKADYRDNTLNIAIADPAKAAVSPASILVPAGQTSVRVSITSKTTGTTSLNIDSPTLGSVRVPVFITADFRGANTAFAPPVGVVVPTISAPVTKTVSLTNPTVGVAVGAVLTAVTPAAWSVGSNTNLIVHGQGIPANVQLALVPNSGVSVESVSVNPDGTQITASLLTAPEAPLGARKVVVKDVGGRGIEFASSAKSVVNIMTGLPVVESIEPFAALRGTAVNLLVRGRHLQQGRVSVVPANGVEVDTQPQVSADGTALTVRLLIASDAPVGQRLIRVSTPAGQTSDAQSSASTLTIASSVQDAARAIVSRPVGVRVGNDEPVGTTVSRVQLSPIVGVLRGGGVTGVMPRVGVIGTDVSVTIQGAGLQGITSAGFAPSAGVSVLEVPTVNAEGTEARFTVRVDATAALGARNLMLKAGGKLLNFARPELSSFVITAPVPELVSVAPQVVVAGQAVATVTARGRNFVNITGVRVEPADGITVVGPFDVGDNSSRLSFGVLVATNAAAGARTVVVSSAAGDSSTLQAPGNLLRVATQVGPTYADLQSPQVGVVLGNASTGSREDRWLSSPMVGLMVGESEPVAGQSRSLGSPTVGLLLGAGAQSMTPAGWLRGANGNIVVNGQELSSVTGASIEPDTGLLVGTPVVTPDGKQLTLSLAVAPDAPMVLRKLRLMRGNGADLVFAESAADRFGIGQMPTLTSVAPIVLEQGKSTLLTIRGSQLDGVTGVAFEPSGAIRATQVPVWGQDGFGEFLKVLVTVDGDAVLGQRVLRLEVPGGITSSAPQVFNSLTVITPQ